MVSRGGLSDGSRAELYDFDQAVSLVNNNFRVILNMCCHIINIIYITVYILSS